MTVILVFLGRLHARGHVEIVDSPRETIDVEHSALWVTVGSEFESVRSSKVCLSFPGHSGVGSFWLGLGEKKEHLGKTKLVELRGGKKEHLGKAKLVVLRGKKKEYLGKTKLVVLRYRSFYQLQKPAATVNHRGGG